MLSLGAAASIPSFRDAILTQEPSLLQTLLGKACASDQGYLQVFYSSGLSSLTEW